MFGVKILNLELKNQFFWCQLKMVLVSTKWQISRMFMADYCFEKRRAAYSSSILYNCAFITTLWIQISLSTCFHSINWGKNEATNLPTRIYLVLDIELGKNENEVTFQILKDKMGRNRICSLELLKGGKVIRRGEYLILIGGSQKSFHQSNVEKREVQLSFMSLTPLEKKGLS